MPDRYRQIFLSLSDAVFIEDAAGTVLDANTAAAWLLGYPRSQLIGRKSIEFLAPASRERLAEQRDVLKNIERHQFDAQYVNAGGVVQNVILDIALLPDLPEGGKSESPGAPVFLVVARPSSKRDELERELRLQRASAGAVNAHARQAGFFVSSRNEISRYPPLAPGESPGPLDWTSGLLQISRLKPALERAWAGDDVNLPAEWFSPGPQQGAPDSKPHWLRISFHPIRLRGAQVTDVFVRIADETPERVRIEDQTWDSQRRFATLASNALLHELNNYLGVILAQASGLRLTMPQGQLPSPAVTAIVDAAQQAAALLRRSTDGSEESGAGRAEISFNEILQDCAPLLAQGSAEVVLDCGADVPPVAGHLALLKTMVLALGRCALTAMRGTGRLSLKTFRASSGMPDLPPMAGLSINAETPARKMEGGMVELALVRAILRHHNGQLETVSSSAQGMLWEVTLPSAQPEETVHKPAAAVSAGSNSARKKQAANGIEPIRPPGQPLGKILLADDEENFRLFTSWALQERGYEVVVSKDGQEAFEKFQDAPQSFSLVILDAYMPRMGGLEAYLRMQVLRPDLPVLFASGFARGPSVDALVAGCPGPAAVLLKPFSGEDLIEAVNRALAPQ